MRRALRQRLVLLVVVALLAALAIWQWQRQHALHPATLLALDPAGITHVEVQAQDGPLRRFVRRDGHWWMTAPRHGRARDAHLRRLSEIAAARVLRWRPRSDFDPARIGLAPPFATVTLDGQTLRFGAIAALAPQRYVAVGEHVALIPARFGADIAAGVDSELAPAPAASSAAR
ncbi:MAG TPA: hypothetical protein VFG73_01975 [Rhodanobacteraceae bacterium]|nr:hypothetical protein [Rhodanobacteraceae bacterium]